jgi:hypothetical protein
MLRIARNGTGNWNKLLLAYRQWAWSRRSAVPNPTEEEASDQGEGQLRQAEHDRSDGGQDEEFDSAQERPNPDGSCKGLEDQVEVGHHQFFGEENRPGDVECQRRRTEHLKTREERAASATPQIEWEADHRDIRHRQSPRNQRIVY